MYVTAIQDLEFSKEQSEEYIGRLGEKKWKGEIMQL